MRPHCGGNAPYVTHHPLIMQNCELAYPIEICYPSSFIAYLFIAFCKFVEKNGQVRTKVRRALRVPKNNKTN